MTTIRADFDVDLFSLDDMGDGSFILDFHSSAFLGVTIELQKEDIKELYREIVKEVTKPDVGLADNFEPIEGEVPGWSLEFRLEFGGVQVFGPYKMEPHWCLVFDDVEDGSQIGVKFSNQLAKELIAKLQTASGPHQHRWSRLRIYVAADHIPTDRELEECRALYTKADVTDEEKRAVLEKLGARVIIGEGAEGEEKGVLIADFYICNCGARREAEAKE